MIGIKCCVLLNPDRKAAAALIGRLDGLNRERGVTKPH